MANQTSPVIQIKDSNVGIGTTSPITQLHVNDGVNVSNLTMLTLSQLGNTADRDIVNLKMSFNNGAVPGIMLSAIKMADAGSSLSFSTGAASNGALGEKMRITSGGNVLIGTTTDSGYKLRVNGTAMIDSSLRLVGNMTVGSDTSQWSLAGVANGGAIWQKSNSGAGGYDDRYLRLGNVDNNGTPNYVLTIIDSNVGIGTTAPGSPLDVLGKVSINSDGTLNWGNAKDFGRLTWDTGKAIVRGESGKALSLGANGTQDYLYINTSGNVGIGTTSTVANSLLNVAGGINTTTGIIGYNTSDTFTLNGKTQPHYGLNLDPTGSSPIGISGYFGIAMATNGAERLRIVGSTGNVLINTTTDSGYRLNVNGNAYVGGTFYQAGGNYRLGIQIPFPGNNYGNGVIYLRVASSASGRIGSLKIRISSTWNWTPAWGYVEATVGFFWTGSAFYAESGTNIISATGYAAYTLNIGQPVEENGYISIPIYSSNSNPIYALVEATPDIDPNSITLSGWSTTTHPGTADVFIQTELGVGTRSPSARLHVSGGDGIINNAFIGEVPTYTSANAQFSHTSRAGAGEYSFLSANDGETFINSKTGYNIRFRVNNADQVIINSSGNVGIGTTAPNTPLGGARGIVINSGAGNDVQIRLQNNTTGSAATDGGLLSISGSLMYLWNYEANDLIFGTNNAESARILSNGNVGIGNSAPATKLRVESSGSSFISPDNNNVAAVSIYNSNNSSTNAHAILSLRTQISGGSPYISFDVENETGYSVGMDNSSNQFRIAYGWNSLTSYPAISITPATSPNVLIGTTTDTGAKLRVYGGYMTVEGTNTAMYIESNYAGGNGLDAGTLISAGGTNSNIIIIPSGGGVAGSKVVGSAYNGSAWRSMLEYANVSSGEPVLSLVKTVGNVGIGTTAPPIKLYVGTVLTGTNGNGTYASDAIAINSSESITIGPDRRADWGLDATTATSTTFQSKLNIWSDNEDHITFGGASTHLVSAWESFKIWINNDSAAAGTLHLYHTSSKTEFVRLTGSGNNWINGGDVGIGTTNPQSKLHVETSSSNPFRMVRGTTNFGFEMGGGTIGLYDYEDVTYRWFVDSVGNVGIGTTSPTEKLHVDGNAVLTYNNSYQGINSIGNKAILARVSPTTGIINYAEYATAANLNGFVMGSDDARVKGNIATDSLEFITNGSTQVTVLSNGNVGIANTNPSEKLSVTGNIRMDNGAADGPQLVLGSSGFSDWNIDNFSGSLRAYYGSTEYTRLTSSGNFGIGVSPSYKLDVAGDTRITSGSLGVGVAPNATDGRIDASNDIVAYQTSDRRLKENITTIANALDKVKSLTGVEFDWKEETKHVHGYEGHDTGIIAQEVRAVMPTAVRTNDSGYLSVRYEKLIGLLVEANKELAARVEELEAKLK